MSANPNAFRWRCPNCSTERFTSTSFEAPPPACPSVTTCRGIAMVPAPEWKEHPAGPDAA